MKIESIVFLNDHMTLDCDREEDVFWLQISASLGWICFTRIRSGESTFVATELRLASDSTPCLPIQGRCVLWSRKAALEAETKISSYRESLEHFG